jgi:tetratricopeptide (TPR) repeat protein
VTHYRRQDVLRILHLQTRQIASWERAGLIPTRAMDETYTFEDLSQMRTLRDLQTARVSAARSSNDRISVKGISAARIRESIDAMQRVAGMRNPLLEASMVRSGSRLTFRHGGALVDPVTRQLAFDFEVAPERQLHVVRARGLAAAPVAGELQEMFLRAVRLEEDPLGRDDAVALYQGILAIDANHAPACINLGTIHYAMREFALAETMYRRATQADPEYALAFFDLGNVLDELQQLDEAIEAYQRAVELVPGYADAHYNLALAFERKGERRRALRHWLTYVRLDPIGPWSSHAKLQAKKILSSERLSIVSRHGRRTGTAV